MLPTKSWRRRRPSGPSSGRGTTAQTTREHRRSARDQPRLIRYQLFRPATRARHRPLLGGGRLHLCHNHVMTNTRPATLDVVTVLKTTTRGRTHVRQPGNTARRMSRSGGSDLSLETATRPLGDVSSGTVSEARIRVCAADGRCPGHPPARAAARNTREDAPMVLSRSGDRSRLGNRLASAASVPSANGWRSHGP